MHIQLRSRVPDAVVKTRLGTNAKPSDAHVAVTGDGVTVFKPDGKRLMILRRGAISPEVIDAAYPLMYALRTYTTRNRGNYAGGKLVDARHDLGTRGKVRYRPLKRDGTLSNTNQTAPVRSAVLGHLDRTPRMPFCREASFSTNRAEDWGRCQPFIQEVAALFQEVAPDRYGAQLAAAKKTHPAYVIPETPFTTVTVNNTVAGAYHTDKGDFAPGFGVMAVFRKGQYAGADFVFPAYGVSCDLQHGDVIFFDPHEVHGNIPFRDGVGVEGEDWIRISMVFYFRERMMECMAPPLELARAKRVRGSFSDVEELEA